MLKKLQAFFVRIVQRVENNPAAFSLYYFLFAAILALRLSLEFFSSHRLFTLDDIMHIGLWFIFIVLSFMIQLHLFSGEKMMKVAKLVIVFFSIALTAPLIDLIITGGVGAKMNYLSLRSWKDIAWSYITIGGSSLSRGATPGIRIEIILLVFASFNYVRTKKQSIFKGIIAGLCIYTVLFLSGAVPLLLGYMVSSFHLQYQSNDQSTVLLLLTADIFLLFFALYRHSPGFINKIIRVIPWPGILLAIFHVVIGAALALKNYTGNWNLTPTSIFWFSLLLVLCICFAAYTGVQKIQETDTGNGNRNEAITKGLLLLMIIISSMISAGTFFSTSLLWSIIFLSGQPPLYLKKIPVLRNLLTAILMLAAAFTGFCTFGGPMIGFPAAWISVILAGVFLAGSFTEHANENGGIFSLFNRDHNKAIQLGKWFSIIALLSIFVAVIFILPMQNNFKCIFLLAVIPPALTILFRPLETKYIQLSFIPAYSILVIIACQ